MLTRCKNVQIEIYKKKNTGTGVDVEVYKMSLSTLTPVWTRLNTSISQLDLK